MSLFVAHFDEALVRLREIERALTKAADIEQREDMLRGLESSTSRRELGRRQFVERAALEHWIAWAQAQQVWDYLPAEQRTLIEQAARGTQA